MTSDNDNNSWDELADSFELPSEDKSEEVTPESVESSDLDVDGESPESEESEP